MVLNKTCHRKDLSIDISDTSDTDRIANIGVLKVDIISLEISNSSSILPTYLEANVCRSSGLDENALPND